MTPPPPPRASRQILPRLSAPITRLRRQWLTMVKDLDPQAALAVLRDRLKGEASEAVRLGNIAAQSWIIRQRLTTLQTALHEQLITAPRVDSPDAAEMPDLTNVPSTEPDKVQNAANIAATDSPSWTKLRILQETEVNGMRFFAGTTIQVHDDDAQKLIAANSAELVTEPTETSPKRRSRMPKKADPKK